MDLEVFDSEHVALILAEALRAYQKSDPHGPRIAKVEAWTPGPYVFLHTVDGSVFRFVAVLDSLAPPRRGQARKHHPHG